ncbi:MAG: hypothetical protein KKE73_00015 [Proteobacteria bacterium]|nr:hypothetical protein [Pseudomonadota bacterium]
MTDMVPDFSTQVGISSQQADALQQLGLNPPPKDQMEKLKTDMENQGLNPQDQVSFSPEALAKALEFVQKSENSPEGDLKKSPEQDEQKPSQGQTQSAGSAKGEASKESASTSSSDQIENLQEEIEELEQEISELQGKTDEQSKDELKVKQQELMTKQAELAELQSNQA